MSAAHTSGRPAIRTRLSRAAKSPCAGFRRRGPTPIRGKSPCSRDAAWATTIAGSPTTGTRRGCSPPTASKPTRLPLRTRETRRCAITPFRNARKGLNTGSPETPFRDVPPPVRRGKPKMKRGSANVRAGRFNLWTGRPAMSREHAPPDKFRTGPKIPDAF